MPEQDGRGRTSARHGRAGADDVAAAVRAGSSGAGPALRGPERFQPDDAPGRDRSPAAVVGAVAALLALVVGVPAGLLALGAPPPVPTSLPDRDALVAAVGPEVVLAVLVAVVWLAWLQFVVCVVVEVVAAVRDGGLPRPVPLAGPSQRLARVLVGTLLLSGVVAGQASAAVPLALADDARPGVVATAAVEDGRAEAAPGPGAAPPTAAAATADLPPEVADLVGKRVYTVVPPEGRHHDNLWDIAEEQLGDGRRYTEIYALNEGRTQPDGQVLELARLIQPGWQLVMPEDATGVERLVAPAPAPVPPDPAPVPAPLPGAGAPDAGADGAAGPAPAAVDVAAEREVLPAGALGLGALTAAGLVVALRRARRRGPGEDPGAAADEAEARLRVGADPARARLLAGALATLAPTPAGPRRRGADVAPVPGVYAALVDDDGVELRLAPPLPQAPAPWTAADDGARWLLAAADLPDAGAPGDAPSPGGPCAALVGLGRAPDGRDVLVDLAAADGPVQVTGPGAHDVVAAMAAGLAARPWSAGLDVVLWDLPPALAGLGPHVDVREDPPGAGARPDGVLSGGASSPRRAVVLGSVPPGGAPADPAPGDVLLVAGYVPGARWDLRVDDAGGLAAEPLGLHVTADRLGDEALGRLGELFAAVGAGDPSTGADGGDPGDRPPLPPAPALEDAAWATARVRVAVLGALVVEAPGAVDPSRRDLVEEVVAHVALHPEGVHPTVLGGDVWPSGAGAAVRAAVVARARDLLGSDPDGSYRLGEDADGRLLLAAGAVCDRDVLVDLLRRSRTAVPAAERDLLRRALALVRGELLAGHPPRRYGWLPRTGAERTTAALVVDAALRLARLEDDDGDPAGGVAAAAAGLRAVPASQPLWRALLAATARSGDDLAAPVAAMTAALHAAGTAPDGETQALLAELAPDLRAG